MQLLSYYPLIAFAICNRLYSRWVPSRLGPYMIEPTRLSPHDCAHTRLCPDTIVPRHDCAHTRLCPDTIVPTHYCAQTRLCPHTIVPTHVCAQTRLCPDTIVPRHDCAHTRLCLHTIVPTHVCAHTRLCPDTFLPTHDCAQTRLCPHTIVPMHVCAQTHLCPDMLYLFCHFCLLSVQVQLRLTLKLSYDHVKMFSMSFGSSIVIGQQLRELACDWPATKSSQIAYFWIAINEAIKFTCYIIKTTTNLRSRYKDLFY